MNREVDVEMAWRSREAAHLMKLPPERLVERDVVRDLASCCGRAQRRGLETMPGMTGGVAGVVELREMCDRNAPFSGIERLARQISSAAA
jgi:hypothetical protein